MLGPAEGYSGDMVNSLVDFVAASVNVEAAEVLAASTLNLRNLLSLSPLHPIPEAGSLPSSLASGAAHPLRQGIASSHVAQPVPSQEAEPTTTPTAELEARAASAMSTQLASCRQSPGDLSGPIAEVGVSPLPLSQLIMGGTTPRVTAASTSLHPVAPPVGDEEPGAAFNPVEKEVALVCPGGLGAGPEHGQAQSGCGPNLIFLPTQYLRHPRRRPQLFQAQKGCLLHLAL